MTGVFDGSFVACVVRSLEVKADGTGITIQEAKIHLTLL